MVIHNFHWLNVASRVLISTCSTPLVQTGERKQTHKWTDGHYQTYFLPCFAVDNGWGQVGLKHPSCGNKTQFFTVWPWTLTYDFGLRYRLAKIKVDPHAKNQGQRSNGSNRRAPADKQTDTHTHTHGRYQTYYAVDNRYTNVSIGLHQRLRPITARRYAVRYNLNSTKAVSS